MKIQSLYFTAPYSLEVREESLPALRPGQVLVRTMVSAISAGTELLIYRGQFPEGMAVDENLSSLPGTIGYPLKYGYSSVGSIIEIGSEVDPDWVGRLIFAFQPHQTYFLADLNDLMFVPPDLPAEEAVFFPNMETAVSFLLDGSPLIGQRVAVFGQGIIGLLTANLLARFPLDRLITFDRYPLRRQASLGIGADASLDPLDLDQAIDGGQLPADGFDLVYELSGMPEALDQAIRVCGFSGRIVIGSWYGKKRASLDLGGLFHRSRIELISSQVSSIAPGLTGRWNKSRRYEVAWEMIRQIRPARWITHRFPLAQAVEAYRTVDLAPGRAIQVVFTG